MPRVEGCGHYICLHESTCNSLAVTVQGGYGLGVGGVCTLCRPPEGGVGEPRCGMLW